MAKIYLCDICGKEVVFLYDLCTTKGIISVCRECYYGIKVDKLCQGEKGDCMSCDLC